MDTSRETRAYIMILYPCPPLPMLTGREDGREVIGNTHDFLGKLIDEVARRGDHKANLRRKADQIQLTSEYIGSLRAAPDLKHTYEAMCRFTRGYLESYFPGAVRDVRVVPYDYAPDLVVEQVRSWLAGREIIGGRHEATGSDHGHKGPDELYGFARELVLKNPMSLLDHDLSSG